jgi:hypothetical protein
LRWAKNKPPPVVAAPAAFCKGKKHPFKTKRRLAGKLRPKQKYPVK